MVHLEFALAAQVDQLEDFSNFALVYLPLIRGDARQKLLEVVRIFLAWRSVHQVKHCLPLGLGESHIAVMVSQTTIDFHLAELPAPTHVDSAVDFGQLNNCFLALSYPCHLGEENLGKLYSHLPIHQRF